MIHNIVSSLLSFLPAEEWHKLGSLPLKEKSFVPISSLCGIMDNKF